MFGHMFNLAFKLILGLILSIYNVCSLVKICPYNQRNEHMDNDASPVSSLTRQQIMPSIGDTSTVLDVCLAVCPYVHSIDNMCIFDIHNKRIRGSTIPSKKFKGQVSLVTKNVFVYLILNSCYKHYVVYEEV